MAGQQDNALGLGALGEALGDGLGDALGDGLGDGDALDEELVGVSVGPTETTYPVT